MRKFTEKDIEKISGAIITSFTNLHYLEEVSRLGVIKHIAKKNLSRTLEDLKLIANKMSFVEFLLNDFSFNDFSKFQEIACAYKLDPKRVTGITDKILLENGAEKV